MASDEKLKNYQEHMGKEFGRVFFFISNELIRLNYIWKEYETLYSKQSRVDLLNKSAPYFFYLFQNILWENIILSIAKLTDPVKIGSDKSITMNLLSGYMRSEREFQKKIKPLLKKVEASSNFSRELRNQWLAHKDFKQVINEKGITLKWPSANKIKGFLESASELLNTIETHYLRTSTIYLDNAHSGGALALLYVVEYGQRFNKLLFEMALKGDRSLDNFQSVI